jgi:hypothetical protein
VSLNLERLREIVQREIDKSRARSKSDLRVHQGFAGAPLDFATLELPLEELEELKDCRKRSPRQTHRRRLGRLAMACKRIFARVFRPFIHDALETQSRFNDEAFEAFSILQERERILAARLAALEKSIDAERFATGRLLADLQAKIDSLSKSKRNEIP